MTINVLSSSFSQLLDDVINYAARFRKPYGYIIIVLDHIHEQQNHIAQLTSGLQDLLKRNVRTTDTIIRFGQDCWLICLDDCDERLLQLTQYILESALHRRKSQGASFEGALTYINGGFIDAVNSVQAIKEIEQTIEVAKSSLRRQKTMRSAALMSTDGTLAGINYIPIIKDTIFNNRIFIAFQPIIESTTRELHHYECLVRILDKEGKVIPAAHFIPQCEKNGLIQLIDQKIQQLAIEELMNDPHLNLAINVSAITAYDSLWLNTLKAQLTARPDLSRRLMIELTETSVFTNIEESVYFMTQLRELGCSISIDDFGAGYMSLSHIKSDLVQTVKIDAQFVRELTKDSNNIHFIRAITALTHPYGILCVAEGVEDEETATLLCQEGVEYLQGYHIGKPTSFRKWMH